MPSHDDSLKRNADSEGQRRATNTPHDRRTSKDEDEDAAATIERRAQRIFGPQVFAHDWTWDLMAHYTGQFILLLPIRTRIESLERHYRHQPEVFSQKLNALLERQHLLRKNEPLYRWGLSLWHESLARLNPSLYRDLKQSAVRNHRTHGRSPRLEGLMPDLSRKQVKAVEYLLPFADSLIAGHAKKVEPKELLKALASLASQRPGPKPGSRKEADLMGWRPDARDAERVVQICRQARADRKDLTDGKIAEAAFPSYYAEAEAWRRIEIRKYVRDTLRSRGLSK